VARLHEAGTALDVIASALGITWTEAKQALVFGKTGERPKWNSPSPGRPQRRSATGRRGRMYKDIGPDVVRLRKEEKLTWRQIRNWLVDNRSVQVGAATIRRAYDDACRAEVQVAAENGSKPKRGSSLRIGIAKEVRIRELISSGVGDVAIAKKVGVGKSTVGRIRRAMKDER
jgi:hypothetical protein